MACNVQRAATTTRSFDPGALTLSRPRRRRRARLLVQTRRSCHPAVCVCSCFRPYFLRHTRRREPWAGAGRGSRGRKKARAKETTAAAWTTRARRTRVPRSPLRNRWNTRPLRDDDATGKAAGPRARCIAASSSSSRAYVQETRIVILVISVLLSYGRFAAVFQGVYTPCRRHTPPPFHGIIILYYVYDTSWGPKYYNIHL